MKKLIMATAIAVFALAVASSNTLAWQEGPGTDWWYLDASYGDYHDTVSLVIKLDGNSASGQTFNVGDTVNIAVDYHAYAASCGGTGNGAYTNWNLEVDGLSGSDSTSGESYDQQNSTCAEVETINTLSISYPLTTLGVHIVDMSSYAAVEQSWSIVGEDNAFASLTFDVIVPVPNKADVLLDSGVQGKGLNNAPGLQKPFNPKSKAADHAGKK